MLCDNINELVAVQSENLRRSQQGKWNRTYALRLRNRQVSKSHKSKSDACRVISNTEPCCTVRDHTSRYIGATGEASEMNIPAHLVLPHSSTLRAQLEAARIDVASTEHRALTRITLPFAATNALLCFSDYVKGKLIPINFEDSNPARLIATQAPLSRMLTIAQFFDMIMLQADLMTAAFHMEFHRKEALGTEQFKDMLEITPMVGNPLRTLLCHKIWRRLAVNDSSVSLEDVLADRKYWDIKVPTSNIELDQDMFDNSSLRFFIHTTMMERNFVQASIAKLAAAQIEDSQPKTSEALQERTLAPSTK